MKRVLPTPSGARVSPAAQLLLDGLHARLGHVPPFYATAAHSAPALSGFLDFTTTLRTGEFSGVEIELIYLAAAEAHQCADAVAAHTATGRLYGLTEAEMQAARTATSPDSHVRAITALARAFVLTQGHPDGELLRQFFAAGYAKAALVELVGLVAAITFHSYVAHLATRSVQKAVMPTP